MGTHNAKEIESVLGQVEVFNRQCELEVNTKYAVSLIYTINKR